MASTTRTASHHVLPGLAVLVALWLGISAPERSPVAPTPQDAPVDAPVRTVEDAPTGPGPGRHPAAVGTIHEEGHR